MGPAPTFPLSFPPHLLAFPFPSFHARLVVKRQDHAKLSSCLVFIVCCFLLVILVKDVCTSFSRVLRRCRRARYARRRRGSVSPEATCDGDSCGVQKCDTSFPSPSPHTYPHFSSLLPSLPLTLNLTLTLTFTLSHTRRTEEYFEGELTCFPLSSLDP